MGIHVCEPFHVQQFDPLDDCQGEKIQLFFAGAREKALTTWSVVFANAKTSLNQTRACIHRTWKAS